MKFRLIHKLLIALFASTAVVLLLILWVARVNIGKGFEDFLLEQERVFMPELATELGEWYTQRGDWSALKANPRRFYQMLNLTLLDIRHGNMPHGNRELPGDDRRPPPSYSPPEDGPARRGSHPPPRGEGRLHRRVFLLDAGYETVIGHVSHNFPREKLTPVEADGEVVGWLGVVSPQAMLAPAERAFVERMKRVLWLGLGLGLVVAAILAWILSRHLGQPVSAATNGIRKLASGDYSVKLETRGTDEIARLGDDINQLARALSDNRDARKRWMADMAHELRTPLAIMQGELEAISDGIRPLSEASISSIDEELRNLNKLVDDLSQLAMSDSGALAYEMHPVDLVELVRTSMEPARNRALEKGLEFSAALPAKPVMATGDDQRLRQLVRILLDNAVLYTDSPGRIDLSLEMHDGEACLQVSDSPPGVPEAECERLFERLYRRESSRNRNSGGSGLGLSIARNIASAHGGSIEASPGPLGGLLLQLRIPVQA